MQIDPWSSGKIENYNELIDEFGISEMEELVDEIEDAHPYHKRNIVFGHRDYEKILAAINKKERYVALSGFVPSGEPHLGHKMVMDQLIWHQKHGGEVFASIANMEALSARGVPLKKSKEIGRSYFISLIALGLERKGSHLYYQSEEQDLRDLAFELSENVNIGKLNSIYGFNEENSLGHLYATVVQSGDILYPQLEKFGGPCPVIVPAGTDQDPHIRLVRDLASSMRLFRIEKEDDKYLIRSRKATKDEVHELSESLSNIGEIKKFREHLEVKEVDEDELKTKVREFETQRNGYGFIIPSSTYHRFMTGLKGGKMSSSVEESYISLTDDPKEAGEKVMRAKTGGRTSIEEQKEKGGEPEKCSVYELLYFHLVEDEDQIEEIYSTCRNGERFCGKCKKETANLLKRFLTNHQEKREKAKEILNKYLE